MPLLLLVILSIQFAGISAFAPPPLSFLDGIKSVLDGALSPTTATSTAAGERQEQRELLKRALLTECRESGKGAEKQKRERIEAVIDQLALVRPADRTASSPLLQKKWILEWTTEKEINFFSDWGISGTISQTVDGVDLGNDIEFKRGGGLRVQGKLSVPADDDSDGGLRTNFKFTSATLDLGSWGEYDLPPVGEGWFDTVYLDDVLRVDTNSRDDILICTPE